MAANTVLLNALREQRLRAVREARAYAERVARDGTLSAADEASARRADAEVTRLGKEIDAEIRRDAETREMDEAIAATFRRAGIGKESHREPKADLLPLMKRDLDAGTQHGATTFRLPETRTLE